MSYYREFPSEAPELWKIDDLSRLDAIADQIINQAGVDPKNGFCALDMVLEDTDLSPIEEDFVTEVSELTYDFLGGLAIESIELSWLTNHEEYLDYRNTLNLVPVGNFHTDAVIERFYDQEHNERASFKRTPIGRGVIVLGGGGPVCLTEPIIIPEEDCHEYVSLRSGMTIEEMRIDMSQMSGVITGRDGCFVRGYPDTSILQGLPHNIAMRAGESGLLLPTTIHQSDPDPSADRRVILIDIEHPQLSRPASRY